MRIFVRSVRCYICVCVFVFFVLCVYVCGKEDYAYGVSADFVQKSIWSIKTKKCDDDHPGPPRFCDFCSSCTPRGNFFCLQVHCVVQQIGRIDILNLRESGGRGGGDPVWSPLIIPGPACCALFPVACPLLGERLLVLKIRGDASNQ